MSLVSFGFSFVAMALFYGATSSMATVDIPAKFQSETALISLFCATCNEINIQLNETLHDESANFDAIYGFRLDSKGKKIRKESPLLKLFTRIEHMCDDWKDSYRVARRKNGNLYLVAKETAEQLKIQESLVDHTNDKYVKRPKYLKKKSKTHKLTADMCHFITEHLEEFLHSKESLLKKDKESGERKMSLDGYCLEEYSDVCQPSFFDTEIELWKVKNKKAQKKQEAAPLAEDQEQLNIDTEYTEEMEPDTDANEEDNDDKSEL